MKRSAALFALATLTTVALVPQPSWSKPSAPIPKVVVIGVDGAMLPKIQAFDTPALKGLIAGGHAAQTTLYAQPFAPTLSGPGWATNATGVWPDKHKVKSNSWGTATDLSRHPDFLTRLERARPLTYGGDVIAKAERLEVAVPAGARRMTITWTLTNGDNDWYWAIDAPHVTKPAP
ncbi:alkaline phosphatase family protein [Kribbella deserti]|uniref:Alkaline phosphatase family protein n=1 Tax=Kribbella deserti TaxID=1926257 RepID=A0ABV6QVI2_9ACTN